MTGILNLVIFYFANIIYCGLGMVDVNFIYLLSYNYLLYSSIDNIQFISY